MQGPAALRFVRMLSSAAAEDAAYASIRSLEDLYPEVACLLAYVERARSTLPGGGYAVHVQARLASGAALATVAHGADLLSTVHDAFEGMEALLQREFPQAAGAIPPWPAADQVGRPQRLH